MSQSDSFIEVVTEEVRRDRLFALMRRYGWIAVLLVVLIVGAAAWNEYRKGQARASGEALGDALLSAVELSSPEDRIAALRKIETDTSSQKAIAGFLEASQSVAAGTPAIAAERLEELAALPDLAPIYRNLAKFRALGLLAGTKNTSELRDGYQSLAVPGSSLRLLAEEQIALTYVRDGDTDAAITRLKAILEDAEVTAGLRQRVSQLMVALGEDPTSND